jgi:hypothetical protein
MRKYLIFVILQLIISITFSSSVSSVGVSEIDNFNDVYHQITTNNQTITEDNQEKPDIDIYKILSSTAEDAGIVDLSIAVKGSIKNADSIHYIVWYNTTNASYYLDYSNGKNYGWIVDLDTNEKSYQSGQLQVTDHIITVIYNLTTINEKFVDLWGYTFESEINESEEHIWFDYVPNSKVPADINISYQDDDDDDDDNNQTIPDDSDTDNDKTSTPGFEIFLLIIATIVLIIFKSQKKKIQ